MGFIVEVAMKPPQPSPPFASGEKGMPISTSVCVQLPTTGRMLTKFVSKNTSAIILRHLLSGIGDVHGACSAVAGWRVHDITFLFDLLARRGKVFAFLHARKEAVPIPEVASWDHGGPCVNLELGRAHRVESVDR